MSLWMLGGIIVAGLIVVVWCFTLQFFEQNARMREEWLFREQQLAELSGRWQRYFRDHPETMEIAMIRCRQQGATLLTLTRQWDLEGVRPDSIERQIQDPLDPSE